MLFLHFILFGLLTHIFASTLTEDLAKRSFQQYASSHNLEQQWVERIAQFLKKMVPDIDVEFYHNLLFISLSDNEKNVSSEGFIIKCNCELEPYKRWDIFTIQNSKVIFQIILGIDHRNTHNRVLLTFPGSDRVEYLPLDG